MAGEEKQAAAQQTFVFLGSLTNEPPASAGSGARKRGDREYEIIKKVDILCDIRIFYLFSLL